MRRLGVMLLLCGCGASGGAHVNPGARVDLGGVALADLGGVGPADLSTAPSSDLPLPAGDGAPPGATDQWTALDLPMLADGDFCQSIVVDPVNPGTLITGCGNNDGRKIKWYRTSDFGEHWTLTNATDMNGDPWGFSIDPNPARDPSTPPTLYSPAGYGSNGAWKSTDGASTWTRLAGADAAFAAYNPYGDTLTDLYHVAILPDDPPNHVLATYHYAFKNSSEGGFGESWDGGKTWVVHPPPTGIGTSHYVIPISATTWCVIAQANGGMSGVWRTTTAGRTGGTAAQLYRDGTISTAAWTKVSDHEHLHGSYTPVKIGNTWYSPGENATEGSIWTSSDDGATWQNLVPGYYWPSPPNGQYMNKNVTGLTATAHYLYSNFGGGPELARAPVGDDTNWQRDYVAAPSALSGFGANPMGNAATYQASSGKWMVFMATNHGVWRYIEP